MFGFPDRIIADSFSPDRRLSGARAGPEKREAVCSIRGELLGERLCKADVDRFVQVDVEVERKHHHHVPEDDYAHEFGLILCQRILYPGKLTVGDTQSPTGPENLLSSIALVRSSRSR